MCFLAVLALPSGHVTDASVEVEIGDDEPPTKRPCPESDKKPEEVSHDVKTWSVLFHYHHYISLLGNMRFKVKTCPTITV